ncbi:MAG: HAMP domain-containing histidine kinase, partial [Microcoleus sp. SIO2G3]|nr:HAMP domain-containing histidine kinase [Microcoleus sp. SIO2G3]
DCYAGQLNQVFMNLISNAIDALESKKEEDKGYSSQLDCGKNKQVNQPLSTAPTIKISTETNSHDWVVIRITDNGAGMSEEVQQKLFDPFFTTKPLGKGTGLGLSISYQIIVEKHSGKLQCISKLGQGTQFIIEIPIRHPNLKIGVKG